FLRWHGRGFGGPGPGEGNVVSGNTSGIFVGLNPDGSSVQGNIVGLDPTATAKIGNQTGVYHIGRFTTIGGAAPGAGNTIAGNTGDGIYVSEQCVTQVRNPASTDTPKFLPDLAT